MRRWIVTGLLAMLAARAVVGFTIAVAVGTLLGLAVSRFVVLRNPEGRVLGANLDLASPAAFPGEAADRRRPA